MLDTYSFPWLHSCGMRAIVLCTKILLGIGCNAAVCALFISLRLCGVAERNSLVER